MGRLRVDPLRRFAEANMTATVHVWRVQETQDSSGGWSRSAAVISTVKGRVSMGSGRETAIAQGLAAEIIGTASLPVGTDVRDSDVLEVVDDGFYEVNAVLPRTIKATEKVLVSRTGRPQEAV